MPPQSCTGVASDRGRSWALRVHALETASAAVREGAADGLTATQAAPLESERPEHGQRHRAAESAWLDRVSELLVGGDDVDHAQVLAEAGPLLATIVQPRRFTRTKRAAYAPPVSIFAKACCAMCAWRKRRSSPPGSSTEARCERAPLVGSLFQGPALTGEPRRRRAPRPQSARHARARRRRGPGTRTRGSPAWQRAARREARRSSASCTCDSPRRRC
jgi:hypothetical protein